MLSLALLLLPLSVLAAPSPQGQLEIRSQPIKPNWAGTFVADGQIHQDYAKNNKLDGVDTDNKNRAILNDCTNLESAINDHNGFWKLNGQTNLDDPNDWNLLKINGTCTLLVKNTAPTDIGTRDAAWYMFSSLWYCETPGCPETIENRSYLFNDKGTRVDFWLRSTSGLDLSKVA